MSKQFVIEAVMLAIYGELTQPGQPVEYLIPVSSLYELEELVHNPEPLMPDPDDEQHVRKMMAQLVQFFHDPFNRKRMEKALVAPWSRLSFPFPNDVTITVVQTEDTALWGELFDPIETVLLLTAIHFQVPLLTDQIEWQDRILEYVIPVQFYDIEDYEFALEQVDP
ncbi:ADP-heptose synthase [Brevibacillus fulvus]|uniref:ADP-heptose synthase n=1 Tax=Brevibacillus fulvus TaxID=1125967 RepID=A0A938Y495_9BACL|nr:ADP-heptose synthase [Brevibacillus fulvus]MBM7590950.1 hypothetical protein [Brevibacillus fulvus]